MNTITTTSSTARSTIRSIALGTVLALLLAGATACGTANGNPSTHALQGHPAPQRFSTDQPFAIQLIEWAKTHRPTYLQQVEAERWNAGGGAQRLGEHQHGQQRTRDQHTPLAPHPPGYNKALLGE